MKKSLLLIVIFISILLSVTEANMPASIPIFPNIYELSVIQNDRYKGNANYLFNPTYGKELFNWYKRQLPTKGWKIRASGLQLPRTEGCDDGPYYLTAFNNSTSCNLKMDIGWVAGSNDCITTSIWYADFKWECTKEIPYSNETISIERENKARYLPVDLLRKYPDTCGTSGPGGYSPFYGTAGDIDEDGAYEYTIAYKLESEKCMDSDMVFYCALFDDAKAGYKQIPMDSKACRFKILPTKNGKYHDLALDDVIITITDGFPSEDGKTSIYSWNGSKYKKRIGTPISNQQ